MYQKYLLFMSYIGTRYRGAAKTIRSNKLVDLDSIEGAIEAGFITAASPQSLCFPKVRISSRTDAGVHALLNAAEITLEHPNNEFYQPKLLLPRINLWFARCGHEIRLTDIFPIDKEFSYRKAKSRTYFYRFFIAKEYGQHQVPIVEYGRSWHVRGKNIDLEALNNALRLFRGKKNYASFSPKNRTNKEINYVKDLMHISLDPTHPLMPEDPLSNNFNFYNITIQSRSFVYNQVRRMIGCLIALASGSITERDIKILLNCPSYLNWPNEYCVAPPQGLYLKSVEYDEKLLEQHIIKVEPKCETISAEKISAIN
ncbi:tRNA pseudouridine synthase-like 1 [Chelonus insularis]|uniref:tRNA pseudouridine synthase-like 1 n=1 Tax=Chelonus insularis TaxID=460826 RepID=UPI001589F743|nr:tRNA pseudouridine synthase-like 1 [Chelonus insularis]